MAKKTSTTKACPTEKEQWTPSKRYLKKMESLPGISTGFVTPEKERMVTRDEVISEVREPDYLKTCNTVYQECFLVVDVDTTRSPWPTQIVGDEKSRSAAESAARRRRLLRGHVVIVMSQDAYITLSPFKFRVMTRLVVEPQAPETKYPSPRKTGYPAGESTQGMVFGENVIFPQPRTIRGNPQNTRGKGQFVYRVSERKRAKTRQLAREVGERQAASASMIHRKRMEAVPDWCDEKKAAQACYAVVAYSETDKKAYLDSRFNDKMFAVERAKQFQVELWRRSFKTGKEPYIVQVMPIEYFYDLAHMEVHYDLEETSIELLKL